MTALLAWLTLLLVVAAIELAARVGLPFDLERVLLVEAVLFPLAGAACLALMRRWPRESGIVRTLQILLAAAFFLGGIRSFVWVATGSVMLANVKAAVTGLAVWLWLRWRRRRGDR